MNKLLLLCIPCAIFCSTALSAGHDTIVNPILAGFYPDPSICRVGNDYYVVNSSFAYFPGLPVFHSTDLAHWSLIGHVMERPEQLDLDSLGVSRGLFAPAIRYHDGLFYVTCTLVDRGGNFVVTSPSAKGPWSDPVWLPQVNGIDPSLFFDDDGKAYLIYNSAAPDNTPLYDGHRTIRMFEFDARRLRVTGNERILINGGTDIRQRPVWNERHFYFLCKSRQNRESVVQLYSSVDAVRPDHEMVLLSSVKPGDAAGSTILLKVEARGDSYAFFYGSGQDRWHPVKEDVPAEFLSTKVAGGFVGCMYALYATSCGVPDTGRAFFDWFEYAGNDGELHGTRSAPGRFSGLWPAAF